MALNIDAKFKEKVTFTFKNDMKNLANMHRLKKMNNKFNKTFYTCLTESSLYLDVRYKQMSKKAIKLGSFLQC